MPRTKLEKYAENSNIGILSMLTFRGKRAWFQIIWYVPLKALHTFAKPTVLYLVMPIQTFFFYVYLAIWESRKNSGPVQFAQMVTSPSMAKKMVKSIGNFMALEHIVQKCRADISRIAIADVGNGVINTKSEEDVADNNILRLYNLYGWC